MFASCSIYARGEYTRLVELFSSPRSLNIHVEIRKIKLERKIPPLPSFQFTRLVPRENLYSQISWQMIFRSCYLYISLSFSITIFLRLSYERRGKERKKNWRFFPKELESLDKRFIYIYRERVSLREETENIRE